MAQKKLFLVIGAPGSGKTTDAKIISDRHSDTTIHFSTGELLRKEVQSGSKLGKVIDEKISSGNLVPVKIAVETIMKAIDSSYKEIIIVDGFPRSVEQMTELDRELECSSKTELKKVIEIYVSEDTAKLRVLGRARGIDDREEIFINRMKVYTDPIDAIRDFYRKKNLLVRVNGEREVKDIVKDIEEYIYG